MPSGSASCSASAQSVREGGFLETVASAIALEALTQGGIHGALYNLGSGEKTVA